jgi:hypothetical protein
MNTTIPLTKFPLADTELHYKPGLIDLPSSQNCLLILALIEEHLARNRPPEEDRESLARERKLIISKSCCCLTKDG